MSILKMLGKALWDLVRAFFTSIRDVTRNLFHPMWLAFRMVFKFKPDEVKRPLLALVSIIVITTSLISIYLSQRTPTPKINLKPFQGLGEVVGEETVKLIKQHGEVVVVVMDTGNNKMPAITAPLDAFQHVLKESSGVRIRATETVKTDLQAMIGPGMLISANQFIALLDKYSSADAIVTFVGVPTMQPSDWERLPSRRPKVIDAGAFSPQLREFMNRDIVQVAIQPRFKPGQNTAEPTTPREWFERFYTVVTAANMSELPDFGMPPPAPPAKR